MSTYTEQEIREHGYHYQPYTTCPICFPEDPRDATIRELRAEVEKLERLISDKAYAEGWPEGYDASQAARTLLRRQEAANA